MIQFSDVQLLRGGEPLFSGATLKVAPGDKVAVIGPNGAGKSSLFQMLLGDLSADQGQVQLPAQWRVAHMQQETPGLQRSAVDHVLDGLTEWRALQQEIEAAEVAGDNALLGRLHGRMDDMQGYQVRHEAEIILLGLGFTPADLERPVADFSGGWRVRLNLAQTLIQNSDLLLLDEPTNHLDLETVHWLQGWLRRYPGTLLLISHDRDFLDAVVDRVISFEHQALRFYSGNFSSYERQKSERLAQQQAVFEKQQQRRAEMERFVDRFRYKATKARQAQSRLKALEKMTLDAPARADSPFSFKFSAGDKVSQPLIALTDAALGYGTRPVLEQLQLSLYPGMRIGLLGRNGAGKSTLIRHLAGELRPLQGESTTGAHYYPGYFAQHQVDELDSAASPLTHLQRLAPDARDQSLRDFLGGFNFRGSMVDEPVAPLSGGEKARLALALIAWARPNVLLLDEPTNHLDLQMRSALAEALQAYEGAVIVVSHDRFLMESTVDEFWLVDQGNVQPFAGDLNDYLQALAAPEQRPQSREKGASSDDRKAQKRAEAQHRRTLSPLKKQVDKALQAVDAAQQALDDINEALADPGLYDAERKDDLQVMLDRQSTARQALQKAEAQWLEAEEALEEAQNA
ncbi:MAG: ATP-binding cassette domain-containing protein [Natronospirillum sp.]|uniref:ABC-F family ATP-binding cassette domain-containing protein n=1 Tax=Natronospirillum sp. TaxID=2812955 RepID=UPI0025F3A96D|nr:ATP-binding cassette domain-containing protein [Natronospirillum sp.]MCH8552558.1 ATP-binding cassette domain-containing protein [Natronospirillum sp.]